MTNKEHQHAEVLRAIADGVPLSEFEIRYVGANWDELIGYSEWLVNPEAWDVRRKPQYIMVNGFKVPRPLDQSSAPLILWTPSIMHSEYADYWSAMGNIENALYRGIAHTTKEAAIAHAKAMLGIDPEYFK